MHKVYLLLGSNLGDRSGLLHRAAEKIALKVGTIQESSSIYETAPWGVSNQPSYLNQALGVLTEKHAEEVLDRILKIEEELGRKREEKWGARLIDIDMLFYDGQCIETDKLTVPHPFLHLRRFVLTPLVEIAPDFVHPVLQQTIREIESNLKDDGLEVKKMA